MLLHHYRSLWLVTVDHSAGLVALHGLACVRVALAVGIDILTVSI